MRNIFLLEPRRCPRPPSPKQTTIINANNSREIEFLNKMNLKIFMLAAASYSFFLLSHSLCDLIQLFFIWHTQKFHSVLLKPFHHVFLSLARLLIERRNLLAYPAKKRTQNPRK